MIEKRTLVLQSADDSLTVEYTEGDLCDITIKHPSGEMATYGLGKSEIEALIGFLKSAL